MRTLVLVLLLLAATHGAAASEPTLPWKNGGPRVRPNDARVASLLHIGRERSPTFSALVDRIEDSKVIVYLETQPRLRPRLAGVVTWVTATPAYRYLRASINPEMSLDQQIAAVAHELHHVVEIIEHPEVTSEQSLVALYRRIGARHPSGKHEWDTAAARDVTAIVRRELTRTSAQTAADTDRISPLEWHAYYRDERARDPR